MILPTRRALLVALLLVGVGLAGYWGPGALDTMLLGDVVLLTLVWIDAALAPRSGLAVMVEREELLFGFVFPF